MMKQHYRFVDGKIVYMGQKMGKYISCRYCHGTKILSIFKWTAGTVEKRLCDKCNKNGMVKK